MLHNFDVLNSSTYKSNINNYIRETKNEKLINAVNKLVSTNPDMLLKFFLTNFLKEYDKTCDYFIIFYDKMFLLQKGIISIDVFMNLNLFY